MQEQASNNNIIIISLLLHAEFHDMVQPNQKFQSSKH